MASNRDHSDPGGTIGNAGNVAIPTYAVARSNEQPAVAGAWRTLVSVVLLQPI